ncbi:hypothetical protein ACIBD9_10610 [Micromonospora sp. NPDC050784]|uniref:hypothetical protein n=1 Tax=Micromonospora sp. NPDC050784 TaxID=3364281 RepID=UPI00379F8757
MSEPPTPDSVIEWFLGLLFGSPSLVVSTFLVVSTLWAWWSFGRDAVGVTSVLLDRSHDQFRLGSFKVQATLRMAVAWSILYLVASFVTQIWAGSQFSPDQGGGLRELLQWSGIFGLIAVAGCLYLVPSRAPKHGDQHWAPLLGVFGGYLLGLVWAVLAFTQKGGPDPGDWWVCPALSCVGVLGSALRMRKKSVQSWRDHQPA